MQVLNWEEIVIESIPLKFRANIVQIHKFYFDDF